MIRNIYSKWYNKFALICVAFVLFGISALAEENVEKYGIVIHGGAGTITKKAMTPEKEKMYREKLNEALEAGYKILENNGSSLDAVEKAITILEDCPLFNSGKGAVFTNNETNELDSSIMDGKTLNAGAVTGVRHIKNPISLARLVMEKSKHVMFVQDGAEAFAKSQGMSLIDAGYFRTERRLKQIQEIKKKEQETGKKISSLPLCTVGAAALDKAGNLAAGTSTGGMTNKRFGRVGDSPIIGAGTYANNKTCAISATGWGEYFIRSVATHDVSAMMEYAGLALSDAASKVIEKIGALGGFGGFIAIDKKGNVAMPFNTRGMYRGYKLNGKKAVIKMYRE